MKLSKNVRYLVRIRDYETVHIEVGAEISNHDLGYTDDRWARTTGRDGLIEEMHERLNAEVDRIAREELTIVAGWSEISPNLAENYLSVEPPTTVQRNHHAKIGTNAASSGGLRSTTARKVGASTTARRESSG